MNQADYYKERLEFWRKQMGLAGYTKKVFELAQSNVKEKEKNEREN